MNMNMKIFFLSVVAVVLLQGCISQYQPMNTDRAKIGPRTPMTRQLSEMPPPSEQIYVAVYKFRDQTGQYKATNIGSTFSTAVTQGATSILLRALEESGWFIPIEREGLSNLLNERKIIRSSRANFEGEEKHPLTPLLFAGVIVEGGIISYETNLMTGGFGAKYFGTGGSAQYRVDRVTIYLRAISTQTGRILKTVYTSKTILSQMIDVNFFRFVSFQRLMEAEMGYSFNEPPEMCVTEAIEKAVQSLVVEGALQDLWQFENPGDLESSFVKNYLVEKNEAMYLDASGMNTQKRRSMSFGAEAGGNLYSGDYSGSEVQPGFAATFFYSVVPEVGLGVQGSYGSVAAKNAFATDMMGAQAMLQWRLLPTHKVAPYMQFGAGALMASVTKDASLGGATEDKTLPFLSVGFGVEFLLSDTFGITMVGDWNYIVGDDLDGLIHGTLNDYYWGARLGLNLHFGR